uniref:Uncharacterized protein n=1 Tax=Globisporangium ultimum (strain ATCC 200006 / CBS 805.95 / DAOM BR144) TaxID=431595 RepID=K3X989_GLOUD
METKLKHLAAASPREPTDAADDNSSRNGNSRDMTSCTYCLGVSVYTKEMLDMREPPRCKGLELEVGAPRDRMETMKKRAPPVRNDAFTFLGIGVSVYSRAWMYEGKHLPAVKGLGVIAIEDDQDSDLMKAIEERKRIMRELEKERRRRQHGDVDDGDDDEFDDDDDDFDLVEELFGDDRESADAPALLEKDPLASVGKPRLPPVLPTVTFGELVDKSKENAKASVDAIYNFWARRLDGFGERYMDSCHRLFAQMEKQATSVPQNCRWLMHRIEETVLGKGDDKK